MVKGNRRQKLIRCYYLTLDRCVTSIHLQGSNNKSVILRVHLDSPTSSSKTATLSPMRKIPPKPPWAKMNTASQHVRSDSMSSHNKAAETCKGIGEYISRLPQILSRFKKRGGPYQNRCAGSATILSTPQEHSRKNQQDTNEHTHLAKEVSMMTSPFKLVVVLVFALVLRSKVL